MNNIRTKVWQKLDYKNPKNWLLKLKNIEDNILPNMPVLKVRSFRTNKLKWANQARQAGIFTYGMAQLTKRNIDFALHEKSDFDFIARYFDENNFQNFVPVQLKELVPNGINRKQSLDDVFEKLKKKYTSSKDVTVGIYISRNIKLDLTKISVDKLNFKEIYLFGSCTKDLSKWFIYGDLQQSNPTYFEFSYPT